VRRRNGERKKMSFGEERRRFLPGLFTSIQVTSIKKGGVRRGEMKERKRYP